MKHYLGGGYKLSKILIGVSILVIIGIIVVGRISHAGFKSSISVPLAKGKITYKKPDLHVIAMHVQSSSGSSTYNEITTMPDASGYFINESKSYCNLNGEKDNNVVLKTIGGHHVIEKLTKSEKCYLYFDLAPTISIDEILAKYIKDDSRSGQLNGKFEESTPNTVYSKTDDDGRSYSFAGKDPNNWVKIGNQYFRIIRFNGRGGMKLIFSGSGAPEVSGEGTGIGVSKFNDLGNDSFTNLDMSYVGLQYTNNALHGNSKNSTVLGASNSEDTKTLYGWLNVKIKPNYESIIDSNAGFCSDRTSSGSFQTYFFPAYYNFFPSEKGTTTPTPSLVCQNSSDLLKLPVGLITVDEYVLAGGLPYISTDSANYYNTSFWLHTGKTYWTMTPRYHLKGISYVFFIDSVGYFSLANGYSVNSSLSVRPVINIKSSTKFVAGGTGTADNPYVVSVN